MFLPQRHGDTVKVNSFSNQQSKKNLINKLCLCAFVVILGFAVAAQAQQFTSGADFLLIGSGARSEGMGGAFTAVADDVNAITFNPAGLTLLKYAEAGYLRMIYVGDLAYNFGGLAVPFTVGENTLAVGAGIVNLGTPEFDSTLGLAPVASASDNAVLLSVAYRVKNDISFGLTGKYLFRNIVGYNAAALGGDFGILATPVDKLRLAAGVFNVGQSVKFISAADSLPTQVKLGLSYEFVSVPQHSARFSLEGAYLLPAQAGLGAAGAEYWFDKTLAARAGFAGDAYQQHWTAGVGVKLQMFQFDYSYSPIGTLGESHRLSVLLRLGVEGVPGLSAPSGFTAEPFDNGIFLKWKPSPSRDVVGYHLYVKKPGALDFTRVTGNPLNDTAVKLKSMLNGKTYAFALSSVSAAGRESNQVKVTAVAGGKAQPPASAVPSATPTAAPAAAAPSAAGPAAPTGFMVQTLGNGFKLSWDKAGADIIGFHLYLGEDPGKPPKRLTVNPIAVDQLELKNIFPNRLYRFLLTSVNRKGGESAPATVEIKLGESKKAAAPEVSQPASRVVEKPAPAQAAVSALVKAVEPVAPIKAAEPAPTKVAEPAPTKVAEPAPTKAPETSQQKTAWFNEGKVKKFTIKAGDGRAMLSWEAVPSAVGYNLYTSFDEKTFLLITKNGPQNILALNIKSLKNGKTYYFAVTAVDVAGHESDKTLLSTVPMGAP
jgi:hypothetical protein